ncbi:penicillin acylase family protein [Hyphococcus sp. DH-69]|uniref:penicillin acylase family protein n=1 Tax=Hyphococcus formosus TaxID=3143534 RepID=UPI00398A779D
MGGWIRWGGAVFFAVLVAVFAYLKTPVPPAFDKKAAIDAAAAFDARIIRDGFGVPHIYGDRDADVAFGLAYAHAEDDWATIEDVIFFSRGTLAQRKGKSAAIPDYLIAALGIKASIDEKYETDLSPEARAIAEAYAAGINFYCAEEKRRCARGAAPVTGKDIVAGFTSRTPFFYGLDQQLTEIFEGDVELAETAKQTREAFLRVPRGYETGSNAMAVAPSRSADGHTRLMVNSHQPFEGPVAWYEARVKSGEGWDMIGGLFPGAPLILHGAGPDLGWAFTVNKPDLVDVYALEVDNAKNPKRYKFDGGWRDLEIRKVKFRVKLFGPLSLPVTRKAIKSVHGPVFVTDNGVFAVSYAGEGDIRTLEQWYRMNRASDYTEWRDALSMLAIPSFNVVYADGDGIIAYYYNAALPVRAADIDWSQAQPGSDPALLWRGTRTLNEVPQVVMPRSGYVVNANHPPFAASGREDNPKIEDFPPHYGIDGRTTNRGLRIQALYGTDKSITAEEFVRYKFDNRYAEGSRLIAMVNEILERADETEFADEVALLRGWDGAVTPDSRAAPLAVLTAQKARGDLLNDVNIKEPDYVEALRKTSAELRAAYGRVDPTWGEVVRLSRGDQSLVVAGGPDTLRAIYPQGDLSEGPLKAVAGDSYILYADWSGPGNVDIRTIHQFGTATLDETSPHYADQAPIFAEERWKTPPMALEDLLTEATADYRPGQTR